MKVACALRPCRAAQAELVGSLPGSVRWTTSGAIHSVLERSGFSKCKGIGRYRHTLRDARQHSLALQDKMYQTHQACKERSEDFEADMEREEDSHSVAEDRIMEAMKKLSSEITADKHDYDRYLEEYLPLFKEHRSYTGKPDTWEYKEGFKHFMKTMEHMKHIDPEVSGLSPYADQETPKFTGCLHADCRVEEDEKKKDLISCQLSESGKECAWIPPSQYCEFKMVQRDLQPLRRPADGSTRPVFLLQGSVYSKTSMLQEATVTLSLTNPEDSQFAAVATPPDGAKSRDVDGVISFEETSYSKGNTGRLIYVGHETSGNASCCMVDSTTARMRLLPNHGTQDVSCLSGLMLVCLTNSASYKVAVSAQASLSVGNTYRKGHVDIFEISNEHIELSL